MIPNWIILCIMVPIFIVVTPFIVLELIMPVWFRNWLVRRQFGVINVKDKGVVFVDGKSYRFNSKNLLECRLPNGDPKYIVEEKRQGNVGLGMVHTFTSITEDEVKEYLNKS